MNSIYSTLRCWSIAGTCSSGLVMRRLVFRSMTITNVVLLPISILRVETIIPSMAIATTAVIVIRLRTYSHGSRLDSWNRTIGTIDQTLLLIEATLYCQEWSCSNIIPTIDKNMVYLYNLEYWSISSIISSEWSSCVFTIYSGIWLTLGLVSIILA